MVERLGIRPGQLRSGYHRSLPLLRAFLGVVLTDSLQMHGCLWWSHYSNSRFYCRLWNNELCRLQLLIVPFMVTILANVYRSGAFFRHLPRY